MNETLLHVLGTIDGTLEPQSLEGSFWQADMQRLAAYRDTRALRVKNPNEARPARRRFERDIERAEGDGVLFRAGRDIGLTAEGDAFARKLAGLPTLADAAPMLAAIVNPDPAHTWSGGWVSESSLCGLAPMPVGTVGRERTPVRLVVLFMPFALALLAARLIEWRVVRAYEGVYLFRASNEGRAVASGDATRWPRIFKRRPPVARVSAAYANAWHAAYEARKHAEPARPNLVHHLEPIDPPKTLPAPDEPDAGNKEKKA